MPGLLLLKHYPDVLFNNRFIDLDDYKKYQLTMDKFLYQALDEDVEDDEELWLVEYRYYKNTIFGMTSGYSNLSFYLSLVILMAYSLFAGLMAKFSGWLFYFDRFGEVQYERGRDGIAFRLGGEDWRDYNPDVLIRISKAYARYQYSFKDTEWYYRHSRMDYFNPSNYITAQLIDLIDDIVWECSMPCIIASFVLFVLYNFTEEFSVYFTIEDYVDFMFLYFCVLADEAVDISSFFNNISTIMFDTQCNVVYIGFECPDTARRRMVSRHLFHTYFTRTQYWKHVRSKRLYRFLLYWEPFMRPKYLTDGRRDIYGAPVLNRDQLYYRNFTWRQEDIRAEQPNRPVMRYEVHFVSGWKTGYLRCSGFK